MLELFSEEAMKLWRPFLLGVMFGFSLVIVRYINHPVHYRYICFEVVSQNAQTLDEPYMYEARMIVLITAKHSVDDISDSIGSRWYCSEVFTSAR